MNLQEGFEVDRTETVANLELHGAIIAATNANVVSG